MKLEKPFIMQRGTPPKKSKHPLPRCEVGYIKIYYTMVHNLRVMIIYELTLQA